MPQEAGASKTVLEDLEPFFHIFPFRHLLLLAAWLEISVVLILLSKASALLKWNVVTYLCVLFICFRIGLWMAGYHKSCRCLGSVLGTLKISDVSVDLWMKCVLGYLCIVSYSFLGIELFTKKKEDAQYLSN